MSSEDGLIKPRGVFKISETLSDEQLSLVDARYSAAATLADLQQEYFLFTPGLFYEFVPLGGREPHVDYELEFGSLNIAGMQLEQPLFTGFPTPIWGFLLWAIPREYAEKYTAWVGSLFMSQSHAGRSWRVRTRDVLALDMLALSKRATLPAKLPTVTLMAWCLEASYGTHWVTDLRADRGEFRLPRACFSKQAYAATAAFQREMIQPQGTNPDPYALAEAAEAAQLGTTVADLWERELAERVRQARLKEEPDVGHGRET